MKALYFLQKEHSDIANYGIVDGSDEMVREAFDYEFLPQCVYIKNGKPSYTYWDVSQHHRILEFMERHEELRTNALPYLLPAPSGLTIYPQYWLKEIGIKLNELERWQ